MGIARRRALGALAALAITPLARRGQAQVPDAFEVPWSDVAPHREGDAVHVAAVGRPDERIRRFEARRDSARRQAQDRALRMLHRWADDALAAVHADPQEASRVHAVLTEAQVERVRPRADASAVVVMSIAVSALREASGRAGLPWT